MPDTLEIDSSAPMAGNLNSYRVDYHVWAAGGRLWPTWAEVEATDTEDALAKAESVQRQHDRERGRAYLGVFDHATVTEI